MVRREFGGSADCMSWIEELSLFYVGHFEPGPLILREVKVFNWKYFSVANILESDIYEVHPLSFKEASDGAKDDSKFLWHFISDMIL